MRHRCADGLGYYVTAEEMKVVIDANGVRREVDAKIRARIVAALEKEFSLQQAPGLQIDFGSHVDTWLSLPSSFLRCELSSERIVAALQKEFGLRFEHGSFVRFGDEQQGADIWLSIPPDFLKGELSDNESRAVAGRAMMIHWNVLPGKFLRGAEAGDLMLIGFGIFPAKFF